MMIFTKTAYHKSTSFAACVRLRGRMRRPHRHDDDPHAAGRGVFAENRSNLPYITYNYMGVVSA